MTESSRRHVAVVTGSGSGTGHVTGRSWPVDGGVVQTGPMAGSHVTGESWRTS